MKLSHIFDKKFVLNEAYTIKPDVNRVILMTVSGDYEYFQSFIHPVHALLLTKFNGVTTLRDCLRVISDEFSISEDAAAEIVAPFLNNEESFALEYESQTFRFPPKTLVENNTGDKRDGVREEVLYINGPFDFKTKRLNIPNNVLFVISTKCCTDCIYCYADRRTKYEPLATKRILEIIEDAKNAGMLSFDISGGEFFLHRDCVAIMEKLIQCGFDPLISTKVPVDDRLIDAVVEKGMKRVQFSLDTLNADIARNTLRVRDDYPKRIKQAIRRFDDLGVELTIKSTFTKYTMTEQNIGEIVEFVETLKNAKEYSLSIAESVLYQPLEAFQEMRVSPEQMVATDRYVEKLSQTSTVKISKNDRVTCQSDINNYGEFKNRSLCSANVDGLIILPDGKVTICEELYWNPKFVIGNLLTNNILEVWNSDKARKLWNIQQSRMTEDNQCGKCQDFDNCRYGLGVCWKMIIMAYGDENHLYPDPRCPRAPKPKYEFYYPGI